MSIERYPVVCAWCEGVTGYTSVPNSHGLCMACYERLVGVPRLSPEQLDALPFGVIQLDEAGVVVGYNRAESALSGRDPAEVLGRNFFTEVAPCTSVKAFQSRFRSVLSAERPLEAFSFSFHFPKRVTEVEIAFVRAPSGVVFVNVRKSTTGGAA